MVRPAFDDFVTSFNLEDVDTWVDTWESSERGMDKTAGLPSAVKLEYISREADWLYSGITADED